MCEQHKHLAAEHSGPALAPSLGMNAIGEQVEQIVQSASLSPSMKERTATAFFQAWKRLSGSSR